MKSILVAFCLAVAPQAISAQQPATPRDSVAGPTEGGGLDSTRVPSLQPVRVTASRRVPGRYAQSLNVSAIKIPARLLDVPQAVSIVTSEVIRDLSIQSVADAVRFMPGVTAGQGEGNRDQVIIRGNSSTADFFVDGVRDDVQFFRDIYNVDRIEALKGPSAMVFGRGGGGGVLNRVVKEPDWAPTRRLTVERGEFGHARTTADLGVAPNQALAARLNSVYESSDSFRDGVERKRYGVNPVVKVRAGSRAAVQLDFEHFRDRRTADRGIPSFRGLPYETASSTFFGDPDGSLADARVNAVTATVSHSGAGPFTVRNHTRFAAYGKFYRNVFPGSMSQDGSTVTIHAYNLRTDRRNLFNQTDLTFGFGLGGIKHAVLVGAELGRQSTDNFRNTGFFNNTSTTTSAPATSPTISAPVTYRQSATDADNHIVANVLSVYTQDQLSFGSRWIAVAGLRYESFDLRFRNNRSDMSLERRDVMLSPRIGLTHKPTDRISLYGMYGVSHLPSSGDQFASLTDVTRGLEPERFTNRELGAKWQVSTGLEMSAARYVLDRTNTRANDPNDPGRIVQTGRQRTSGYELEFRGAVTPSWDVIGGVSRQDARIRSATTSAPAGARVPLVPRITAAMWNRYQLSPRLGMGAGVNYRARSYAAIDNKVTLPAFTRVDGALYYSFARGLQAQINVDNLLDRRYYPAANNNNNISVGEPRWIRLSIATEF